jgi:tRNA-dihydrouridine synthase 3
MASFLVFGLTRPFVAQVHGRSRLQRYSNLANWDYISEVAQSQSPDYPRIPVIGNGDIMSFTDYEEKIKHEGVSATAMLGRGALIKPWLPTEVSFRSRLCAGSSFSASLTQTFIITNVLLLFLLV